MFSVIFVFILISTILWSVVLSGFPKYTFSVILSNLLVRVFTVAIPQR